MNKRIAICPGSFDPITLGHLDIINRTAELFDEVIVLVMPNSNKSQGWFTFLERANLIEKVVNKSNIRIDYYSGGLLIDYAKKHNAIAIVKGLRAVSDFDYEFQMALTNKTIGAEIETIFMPTDLKYMFLSSSVVKDVAKYGGDISSYVPKEIEDIIKQRGQKMSS